MKLTQGAIAKHLFCTRQRVAELVKEGVLPETGSLDLYRECYIRNLRERAAGYVSADGKIDLTHERALLARSQREKIDTELAVRRGELLERDAVTDGVGRLVSAARSRLLAMPTRLGPLMLNHKKAAVPAEIIREEVYAALTELSRTPNLEGGEIR